jgi:ABC-type multidrug transport system ATPase subunit
VIGYLPEETYFYEELSAYENLIFYSKLFLVPESEIEQRIQSLAEQVGLTQYLYQPVSCYSSGMKKRLSIIRTLIHNPSVVLLDEPTNTLDVENREAILDIIKQFAKNNKTVIISSHNLHEIEQVCDQFLIIQQTVKYFGDRFTFTGEKDVDVKFQLYKPLKNPVDLQYLLEQIHGVSQVFCEVHEITMVVDRIEIILDVMKYLTKHNVEVLFVFPLQNSLRNLYFSTIGGKNG